MDFSKLTIDEAREFLAYNGVKETSLDTLTVQTRAYNVFNERSPTNNVVYSLIFLAMDRASRFPSINKYTESRIINLTPEELKGFGQYYQFDATQAYAKPFLWRILQLQNNTLPETSNVPSEAYEDDARAHETIRRYINYLKEKGNFTIDVVTCNGTYPISYIINTNTFGKTYIVNEGFVDNTIINESDLYNYISTLNCIEEIELEESTSTRIIFESNYRKKIKKRAVEQLKNIKNYKDLIDYTVQFLQGEHPFTPFHYGRIDPETVPLIQPIVDINKLGFVTIDSQNGVDACEGVSENVYNNEREYTSYVQGFFIEKYIPYLHSKIEKYLGRSVKLVFPGDADIEYLYEFNSYFETDFSNIADMLKRSDYKIVIFYDTKPCNNDLFPAIIKALDEVNKTIKNLIE